MVPKIRFKSFSASLGKHKIEDILARFVSPVSVSKIGKYREIGIRSHGRGLFYKEEVSGAELGNKRVFWIKKDAVIFNIVFAWEQAVAITSSKDEGCIASHRFPMYLPKDNKCNTDYIRRYFLTKKGKYLLELASPGGAGRNKTLGQKNFDELVVTIPDVTEQTKIADFLSSVDEKITLLNKQYDLVCQYKKGMMQKIFSQEVRFKDENGKVFPGWDRKFIGNILKIGSGRDYKHLNDGNVPVFGTGGFMTMVDQFLFEGETVCIGRKGTIDKPFYYNGKIWTVDTLFYTHEFKGVHPKFVYQLFLTINWKEYNEASGVPSLSKNTIEKIEVNIPCLSEQNKISSYLSALDDKIAIKKAELDKLKIWKQGLLQQMFV